MSQFDELPEGWEKVTLGDTVDLIRGITFPASEKLEKPSDESIICLRTSNVQTELETEDVLYVPRKFLKRQDQWLKAGDIVISMANSYELVGKVAFARTVLPNTTIGGFISIIRPLISDPLYFFYLLRSSYIQQAMRSTASRTVNIANISLRGLQPIEIPLPPLNEQRRIVEKIEALTARSRKAREALKKVFDFEKSLVARYATGWKEEQLGTYIEEYNQMVGEEWHKYPVVGLSNEGKITERREPLGKKNVSRCKIVRPGDIVFNPIRFSIGSVARFHGKELAIVSPEYQIFRAKKDISGELLVRYLRSSSGRSRLEIETQGSVRYRVYLRNLQALIMPVAPPEIQVQAEKFFLTLNKISEKISNIKKELDYLDQSILAKAFRGELVPQDPNDEPAAVLLERIRAERERLGNSKKRGKAKT